MAEKIEAVEKYGFDRTVSVGTDGVPVRILTSSNSFSEVFQKMERAPGLGGSVAKVTAILEEKKDSHSFIFNDKESTLLVKADPELISKNLEHAIYCLSEVQRNKEGRFTMHGAAVSDGEESILILGNKGSGKTTLTLELCKSRGYKLYGNDILVVGYDKDGTLCVHGGDAQFKPRQLSLRDFPDLFQFCDFDQRQGLYDAKSIISPATIGVDVERSSKPIKRVVQVFIDANPDRPANISSPPRPALTLNLFENATRYIRATSTPVISDSGILLGGLPSFDNEVLGEIRAEIIRRMMDMGIETISGSKVSEVADYLVRR